MGILRCHNVYMYVLCTCTCSYNVHVQGPKLLLNVPVYVYLLPPPMITSSYKLAICMWVGKSELVE